MYAEAGLGDNPTGRCTILNDTVDAVSLIACYNRTSREGSQRSEAHARPRTPSMKTADFKRLYTAIPLAEYNRTQSDR